MADWYYIGHYGQLGPLTPDQMDELIQGGVIARDTYVWQTGMTDWVPADKIKEFAQSFSIADPYLAPPPPPSPVGPPPNPGMRPVQGPGNVPYPIVPQHTPYYPLSTVQSDKSRVVGGLLQLLPGVGRFYLGYSAIGALQLLVTVLTCGMGWIWPIVDGVLILAGTVQLDGYGRQLRE